jgi:hypothetical protein
MAIRTYCSILIASVLIVGSAWAKDLDGMERAARSACLSGDPAKGIAILSELFVDTEDPVFIFDQGRCFEQNRRCEEAISRFEEYLRVGKRIGKGERAGAQKHIAECQEALAKQFRTTSAGPATGEPTSRESKERAAKKACLTGDLVVGIAILTDLYLDTSNPTHLFNQGRCFEQNRRYEDATGRFREYLEKAKDLSAEDKADTHRHISNCESYLRAQSAEARKSDVPNVVGQEVSVAPATPPEGIARAAESRAGQAGRGLRIAGGVVAGLGVAGLATGLVLNLKANTISGDLQSNWNSRNNSTRQDYETSGWIAYGAGTACVVGGILLYYLGWRRGERAVSIAALPTVRSDLAGVLLVGAF